MIRTGQVTKHLLRSPEVRHSRMLKVLREDADGKQDVGLREHTQVIEGPNERPIVDARLLEFCHLVSGGRSKTFLWVQGTGSRLCGLKSEFHKFAFDVLGLMHVQVIASALEVHAKQKFCLTKIFDVEFLFLLGFEYHGILADDDEVINMGIHASGWLPGLISANEDTGVSHRGKESDGLEMGAEPRVPGQ
jgi:hypothetical protein